MPLVQAQHADYRFFTMAPIAMDDDLRAANVGMQRVLTTTTTTTVAA